MFFWGLVLNQALLRGFWGGSRELPTFSMFRHNSASSQFLGPGMIKPQFRSSLGPGMITPEENVRTRRYLLKSWPGVKVWVRTND